MNMSTIQTATGAKNTGDIIKRRVIGDIIELWFEKFYVTVRLKEWNRNYLQSETFTITKRWQRRAKALLLYPKN